MIVLLFLTGLYSLTAIAGWKGAASELAETHAQNIKAETLRANTQRQINFAYDFIIGENKAETEFNDIQIQTESLIKELKSNSITETEVDLIEGLQETQFELVWLMRKYFEKGQKNLSSSAIPESRARLREIGDEVADDVAALNRYYGQQRSRLLKATSGAGRNVIWVVGATVTLALIQFVALVALSQKWLVKPIDELNRAARAISGGDLDLHIDFAGQNEWSQLADSINRMTRSLKISRQKLAAHERSAAMGELAAYASHNIRNPLAGIRAATQIIIKESPSLDTDTVESLTEIIETIDRLDAWLKRLLEFARPLEPQLEPVDINQAVRESVEIARKSFAGNNTKLLWRMSDNLPLIQADLILIEQAISAIAANAFEAVDGNGTISIETALPVSEDGSSFVEIKIADDGSGVPEDLQPKLFRAFMTSKDGGTGLGLAQAKKIVDMHSGDIKLTSKSGEGAIVTIRLPLRVEND